MSQSKHGAEEQYLGEAGLWTEMSVVRADIYTLCPIFSLSLPHVYL